VDLRTAVRIVLVVCPLSVAALCAGAGASADGYPTPLAVQVGVQVFSNELPQSTNAVASGTTLSGGLFWKFNIANFLSSSTVTDPTISVSSGYDPSRLDPFWTPASSLPIVASQPSLGPDGDLGLALGSSLPGSFQTGCATSRSVSPLLVPPGGGEQTITFTVRCIDPAVTSVNGGIGQLLPGTTLVSFGAPPNADRGEFVIGPPGSWFGSPGDMSAGLGIGILNLVTGKPYTFMLVVQSPNPFGVAYAQTPDIGLNENVPQSSCIGCDGPQTNMTVPVPSLDGPTPGAGSVTFSAGEPHTWNVSVTDQRKVQYAGTRQVELDYAGPTNAVAGQPVTFDVQWETDESEVGVPVTFTLGSQSCTATTDDEDATCTITLAQPVGSYTLAISSPGDVSVYPVTGSSPFAVTGPTTTDECKNGGWKIFGIFKNQGDCVSYVATDGKNPPG
jgi:hypothetical protein